MLHYLFKKRVLHTFSNVDTILSFAVEFQGFFLAFNSNCTSSSKKLSKRIKAWAQLNYQRSGRTK